MTTNQTAGEIADGTYFLFPEGSAWIAAKFRGGKYVGGANESDADTHAAANDSWGGVVPGDDDKELSVPDALPIIREVMGDDVSPEMVIVARAAQ